MNEYTKVSFTGLMQVREKDTNKLIRSKFNAVHPQNMALAIARSLAIEFTKFAGQHQDKLKERVEDYLIPFFNKNLSFE